MLAHCGRSRIPGACGRPRSSSVVLRKEFCPESRRNDISGRLLRQERTGGRHVACKPKGGGKFAMENRSVTQAHVSVGPHLQASGKAQQKVGQTWPCQTPGSRTSHTMRYCEAEAGPKTSHNLQTTNTACLRPWLRVGAEKAAGANLAERCRITHRILCRFDLPAAMLLRAPRFTKAVPVSARRRLLSSQAPSASRIVDMRSDTVTRPDAKMTVAMMDSATGDDVMGEGEPKASKAEAVGRNLCSDTIVFLTCTARCHACVQCKTHQCNGWIRHCSRVTAFALMPQIQP